MKHAPFLSLLLLASLFSTCSTEKTGIDPASYFTISVIKAQDGDDTTSYTVKDTVILIHRFPRDFSFNDVTPELCAYLDVVAQSPDTAGHASLILGKGFRYALSMSYMGRTRNGSTEEVILMTFIQARYFKDNKFTHSEFQNAKPLAPEDKWMLEYNMKTKKFQNFRYAVPVTSQSGSDSTSSPEPAPSP